MNCLECQEQLQSLLDGASLADQLALAEHLGVCPSCRELHACARRLLEQFRVQETPTPSPDLAIRIRQSVVNEARRRVVFRRLAAVSAAAACIAAVVAGSFFWPRRADDSYAKAPITSRPSLSLSKSVEEAGQAVLAMTRRAADETIDQGRVFLPRNLPEGPTADAAALEPLLDQPARSLREMQDGMSAGLEPVASSARRAVDLFLRELPGSDRSNKRGS
jgi:hypothetical protein